MQLFVALILTCLGMYHCAPLQQTGDQLSSTINFQLQFIDDVEISDLPNRFRNIAVMCDVYRKINALPLNQDTDFDRVDLSTSKMIPNHNDIIVDNEINYNKVNNDNEFMDYSDKIVDSEKYTEHTTSPQKSKLIENIEDWMGGMNAEAHKSEENTDLKESDEDAIREKRVKRSQVSNVPAELAKLFEGVCLTDECLQVLRDYLKWRRENGYPVYTGVTQIGK